MTGLVTGSANLLGAQLTAPPGTRMTFHMATPPLGWVTDATLTDHAMRVVTGAGGGTGGSVNHSTYLGAGTFNLSTVTLAAGNIPSHTHQVTINHNHGFASTTLSIFSQVNGSLGSAFNMGSAASDFASTGITINNNGSGTSFTPNLTTPNLRYAAFVVAQKS